MINSYMNLASRFVSVGLIATALHAAVYWITNDWLLINPHIANVQGYLCAVMFSYYFQMRWTFSSRATSKGLESFTKFIMTSFVGFSVNAFFVFFVNNLLVINANYALIGIIFLTPLLTFVLLNYWVFPERNKYTN
jgi:putative flippase GtrA